MPATTLSSVTLKLLQHYAVMVTIHYSYSDMFQIVLFYAYSFLYVEPWQLIDPVVYLASLRQPLTYSRSAVSHALAIHSYTLTYILFSWSQHDHSIISLEAYI